MDTMRGTLIGILYGGLILAACGGSSAPAKTPTTAPTATLIPAPTPRSDLRIQTTEGKRQMNKLAILLPIGTKDDLQSACTTMTVALGNDPRDTAAVGDSMILLDNVCLPIVQDGDLAKANTGMDKVLAANH